MCVSPPPYDMHHNILNQPVLTVQGIWDLQRSDMPDEEKAALSVLCYQEARGKASHNGEEREVASGHKEAEVGQAWGAQSPIHHKAPTQVSKHA